MLSGNFHSTYGYDCSIITLGDGIQPVQLLEVSREEGQQKQIPLCWLYKTHGS